MRLYTDNQEIVGMKLGTLYYTYFCKIGGIGLKIDQINTRGLISQFTDYTLIKHLTILWISVHSDKRLELVQNESTVYETLTFPDCYLCCPVFTGDLTQVITNM